MILSLLLAGMGTAATAQNINLPIIQTKYTADPAPYVHNDTVYLYTTHDEDGAEGFLMKDWLLYTSTDMVNWQDRGAVASLKDFKWLKGENGAWAEQVIERNGKWYMYCPIHGHGIGVLVADNPYGPFKDPIGKPLAWELQQLHRTSTCQSSRPSIQPILHLMCTTIRFISIPPTMRMGLRGS